MSSIILIKNMFVLKNLHVKYLLVLFIVPMALYLINVVPFMDEQIKIWSSVGIWISSPIICSYMYVYDFFSNQALSKKRSFIFNQPISMFGLLFSGMLISLFIAFLELIISFLFTMLINNISISILDFIFLFIKIVPIVSSCFFIGIISSIYNIYNVSFISLLLICVSFVQYCRLLPLDNSSEYNIIYSIVVVSSDVLNANNEINLFPALLWYTIAIIVCGLLSYLAVTLVSRENES